MAKFFYTVRDSTGKKTTGFEEGSTIEEIVTRLQAKDLIVIDVSIDKGQIGGAEQDAASMVKRGRSRLRHRGISGNDLVLFCRQLATLLGAGVTILKSLEIIALQVSSSKFYLIINELQKNMEAGLSLHEAMSKHPEVFSELWVNLCESGEASGNLAVVLSRLATYLERSAEFKRKLISAVIYPCILFLAGGGAMLFLTLKIIPTFADLFKGFNITLPVLTQILIGFSNFLKHFFLMIIISFIVAVVAIRKYINTKVGRRNLENLQLRLPIFGELFRALSIERFSSEMSTLVESGVPILYSLEIAEHSVGNSIMSDIIRQIKEDVREGKPLNQPLAKSGFFEPMVVQMITIGEEIGELSPMFKKINAFYQEYVENFMTRFATIFEPIMLIIIGGMIGVIVVGMFLPIFEISQIK
ncbi:MAG: type II secretion system F family protein [Candidatus Omnitrophica bacterium]|nr:type II secretion system F family protein [Candidatus Omnitrophota bacterium]